VNLLTLERLGALLVGVATPIVIVAAAVLLFLNPIWVGFEQTRSDVTGWTGYSATRVGQATGAILSDLVFGPPSFDVTVNGQPVLDARERSHMADVRGVFANLGLVAIVAALLLVVIGLASRGRRWFWQAAAAGARVLIGGVVVVGIALALFFDQVFLLFHEIFFPPGTYMFDPRIDKLVQLFPDQFWSETSIALAAAILIMAMGVVKGAGALARRAEEAGPAASLEMSR
jgi:integral membrane protein (TIGR01906 family)